MSNITIYKSYAIIYSQMFTINNDNESPIEITKSLTSILKVLSQSYL